MFNLWPILPFPHIVSVCLILLSLHFISNFTFCSFRCNDKARTYTAQRSEKRHFPTFAGMFKTNSDAKKRKTLKLLGIVQFAQQGKSVENVFLP